MRGEHHRLECLQLRFHHARNQLHAYRLCSKRFVSVCISTNHVLKTLEF